MAEEHPIALQVSLDASSWPEPGVLADSPHDTVEWPIRALVGTVEPLALMSDAQREALYDWAPPFTWFAPTDDPKGAVLLTPSAYPRKGGIYHGQIVPAVIFSVFVRLGDFWHLSGSVLYGRGWAGLARTCRRPVPFMGFGGVIDESAIPPEHAALPN